MANHSGCEILIVGAGITGLAVARELVMRGAEGILIIEKEPGPGAHASGRNSGVLHAGIYYTPDTLKARYCIEGNRLMRAYCLEKGLTLNPTGKVIVAKDDSEIAGIYELKSRADKSGADARVIDARELREIEPHAITRGKALFSPNTAVFRPMEIVQAMEKELLGSGKVKISYNTPFIDLNGDHGAVTPAGTVGFKHLVNAAGAYADRIAHRLGVAKEYRILPFKGTYKKLSDGKRSLVRGNIYPVPDLRNPFLGVHVTHGADGEVTIGPTAIPAFGREHYGLFKGLDIEMLSIAAQDMLMFLRDPVFRYSAVEEIKKCSNRYVFNGAKQILDGIAPEDIGPYDKIGIRAQLIDRKTGKLVMDFLTVKDGDAVHVLNAVSPGFTSSMAFARHVVDQVIA